MFSSRLGPASEKRSRSKSPGPARNSRDADNYAPVDDKYRQAYKPRPTDPDSDDDRPPRSAPVYEERTPDAYEARPARKSQYYEDDRRYSRQPSKYADYSDDDDHVKRPTNPRPRTDVQAGYSESHRIPRSPRSSPPQRANGSAHYGPVVHAVPSSRTSSRASSPQPGARPAPVPLPRNAQYHDAGKFEYAKPNASDVQYKYGGRSREASFAKHYDTVEASPDTPKREIAAKGKIYHPDGPQRRLSARPQTTRDDSDEHDRARAQQVPSPRRQSYTRERSPNPASLNAEQLRKSLGRLSTSGASLGVGTTPTTAGAKPPGSPLLESYKGTYQMISPLPSPLALVAIKKDDDISDLDVDDSDEDEIAKQMQALQREKQRIQQMKKSQAHDPHSPRSSGMELVPKSARSSMVSAFSTSTTKSGKTKKAVTFYDPDSDAEKIAEGLKGSHRSPDVRPLLKIMPWLTTDEIIHLKQAYKKAAKVGGQGINLSKHIKVRISGNLGKILYATSLGQYESDAYWANCFYQSGASRRELLIESLVGRSNQQIREIKDAFKDKKYDDDLEKCMKAELKADKFRTAILLSLEERRMPEGIGLDMKRIHEDGLDLYQALNNPGGESMMISIVLTRSNDHLKEVLRYYEKSYGKNFAREMIRKSQNLVVSTPASPSCLSITCTDTYSQGETLAHILNGALNRAMRDAILLHQAIDEFAPHPGAAAGKEKAPGRAELLISRVVRLHWEPKHLERVKREYETRYGENPARAMVRDVQGNMKTEEGKMWSGFAIDLVRSSEP